ncbi:MAG TPA: hypothetical protein VGC31_08520 [Paenirhodobacter sp.]
MWQRAFKTQPAARLQAEDGAITVDWVVLTALLVAVGFAAGTLIWGRTENAADRVGEFVGAQDVNDQP